jgi:type IV pilus assembly protein PilM
MADESIWKKDLSFRKKSGPPTSQPAPAVPQGERPSSIWKRELKFRSPFEVAGTPAPEPAEPAEPAVEAPAAPLEPEAAQPGPELAPTTWQPLPEPPAPPASPVADAAVSVPAVEAQPAPSPAPAATVEPAFAPAEAANQPVEAPSLQTPPIEEPAPEAPVETPSVSGWIPTEVEPFAAPEAEQAAPATIEPERTMPADVEPEPISAPFDTAEEQQDWSARQLEPAPAAEVEPVEPVELVEAPQPVETFEAPQPVETFAAPEPIVPSLPTEEHPATEPPHPVEQTAAAPLPVEVQAVEPPPAPAANWSVPKAAAMHPEADEIVQPQTVNIVPVATAAAADLPAPTTGPASPAASAKSTGLKREIKLSLPRRRKAAAAVAATATAATIAEPVVVAAVPTAESSTSKRAPKLPKPGGKKTPAPGNVAPAHKVKSLVGLRIGSSQLAAAYIQNNGTAELEQIARSPIPRGIVSGGEVRDPEALTRELKKFFAQHKLPRRGVRLGIASNRIGVRMLEVPLVDDPKLFDNSIRFHAQEVLPIPVTDAILDYVRVGDGGNALEPTARLLLVFAHRELVERHVDACKRAGLKLEGVDFEAFALLRALTVPLADAEAPTQAIVAVAVGHERTIFAVSDGRTCDFTRVLEWGGGTLDVAVGRALNLTPSQAEPVKLALALDGSVAPSQLSAEEAEAARGAIRTEIQTLARELVSSLQFYQSRPESLDIGSILLSGGGSELNGFAVELERAVGVPVVLGDPLSRVELGRKIHRPAELGSLAVAIGLGIED